MQHSHMLSVLIFVMAAGLATPIAGANAQGLTYGDPGRPTVGSTGGAERREAGLALRGAKRRGRHQGAS